MKHRPLRARHIDAVGAGCCQGAKQHGSWLLLAVEVGDSLSLPFCIALCVI